MLNLRQVNETSDHLHTTTRNSSTIRFNANILVGNIGESLQFGTQNNIEGWEDNDVDKDIARDEGSHTSSHVRASNERITEVEVSEYNCQVFNDMY
jgi:hypothetical protein